MGGVTLLIGLVATIRAVRAGLFVTDHGLTVRKGFHTRNLAWGQIRQFRVHETSGIIPWLIVAIDPYDEKTTLFPEIATLGFASSSRPTRTDAVVADLNAVLHDRNRSTSSEVDS